MINTTYAAQLVEDRRRERHADARAYRLARLARRLPLGGRRASRAQPATAAAAHRVAPA
jgi:hypothetical protein